WPGLARDRLTIPQPLQCPWPVHLDKECRRHAAQGRRIHRLLRECRLAARIALGGSEEVHFGDLHATGARAFGFKSGPSVMFVGFPVKEIKRLVLVAINVAPAGEDSCPGSDIGNANNELPRAELKLVIVSSLDPS